MEENGARVSSAGRFWKIGLHASVRKKNAGYKPLSQLLPACALCIESFCLPCWNS